MARSDIMKEITDVLGGVPGWLDSYPDGQLEHAWDSLKWVLGDTRLSAREKALVSFGAAAAVQCQY